MEHLKRGCLRSLTHVQRRACIITITLDGLNTVVEVKNALNEQLCVVVSTNTVRRTLHERGLGSLKNKKNPSHC